MGVKIGEWDGKDYWGTLSLKKKYLIYTAIGQLGALHISEQYRDKHTLFVSGDCPSCGEHVSLSISAENPIATQCGHVTFDDNGFSIEWPEFWGSNHAPNGWQRDSENNKAYLHYSIVGQVGTVSVATRVCPFNETAVYFIGGSCPACSKTLRKKTQYRTLKWASPCKHIDISYEAFRVHLPVFPNFAS